MPPLSPVLFKRPRRASSCSLASTIWGTFCLLTYCWSRCKLQRNLEPVSENYLAQAHCILNGIADFIDRLKSEGIYDNTAIIISGDHGHNSVPLDQEGQPLNYSMYEPLLGTGRPALLVKNPGSRGQLRFNNAPTDMLNIAPTALSLAGLPTNGRSVFDLPPTVTKNRIFQHYQIGPFWSGNPVPYLEYQVQQAANNAGHWMLRDMVNFGKARAEYLPVNKKTARGLIHGAELRSTIGKNHSSWIRGRQLAFLIDTPSPPTDGALEIELAFEPSMINQAFSVQVNGSEAWHSGPVPPDHFDGEFRPWSVPVEQTDLGEGPDFVSMIFETAYSDADSGKNFAVARIRNVRFISKN